MAASAHASGARRDFRATQRYLRGMHYEINQACPRRLLRSVNLILVLHHWRMCCGAREKRKKTGVTVFRFEDYPSWPDLTKKLYQLHPIGSPFDKAVETITNAGAKCSSISAEEAKKIWDVNKSVPTQKLEVSINLICDYAVTSSPFVSFKWRVYLRDDGGQVAVIRAHSG